MCKSGAKHCSCFGFCTVENSIDALLRVRIGTSSAMTPMGGIIDEMIRGYAKGYLFGRMVVGCFCVLLFAIFLGAILVLLMASYFARRPLEDVAHLVAHRYAEHEIHDTNQKHHGFH